jgi:pimeloyl-ACP methyl ester carboxylesterase
MTAEEKLVEMIPAKVEIRRARVGSFDINYIVAGQGEPVLLIHGVNIGWGQWYPNIAELARHFTVYAIDLPGAGASSRIDFSRCDPERDLVDTVEGFIEGVGLANVAIVGHSLGGWIALKLALRRNAAIRKPVSVNSLGFCDELSGMQKLLSLHFVARMICKTVMSPTREHLKRFLADPMRKTQALEERFVDYVHDAMNRKPVSHPLMLMSYLSEPFRLKRTFVLADAFGRIDVPVLVVGSDGDPITQNEYVHRSGAFPALAAIKIFKGCGHIPSLEASREFNETVIQFLSI